MASGLAPPLGAAGAWGGGCVTEALASELPALDAALAAYWDPALSEEPLGSHRRMAAALAAASQQPNTPPPPADA
jgi:hypothetical protein